MLLQTSTSQGKDSKFMLLTPIFQKYGQIKRKAGNIMAKEKLLFMIQECIALCEQEKETGYQGEATKE